jgi:hypothetical protein
VALDERLQRELDKVGRPADPSGVYEDLIRRRERRRMARRLTLGGVSVAVIAACIVGVLILSRVFAPAGSRPGADGGIAPSVQPVPSASPTVEPGRPQHGDIGLGFPVCDVTRVPGTFAPGVGGTAWVATRTGDVGCPRQGDGMQVLAVDVTGDGLADTSYGPLECDPWCAAFAAPDVDGDGADELLIQNVQFSVYGLRLYDVATDPPAISPVILEPPGHVSTAFGGQDFEANAEPQFWLGGDAGISESIRCQAYPEPPGRVVISSAAAQPVDSTDGILDVSETWFVLEGDRLRIVDYREYTAPITDKTQPFLQTGGCGADLSYP